MEIETKEKKNNDKYLTTPQRLAPSLAAESPGQLSKSCAAALVPALSQVG